RRFTHQKRFIIHTYKYNTPPAKFPPSPTVLNNFLPPAAEAQKLPAERPEQRLSAYHAAPLTAYNNAQTAGDGARA
ncbi:MAG: hypothetical protein LBD24_04900, partial [Spirochaetaceae bacterium]|nr:hypothetical protein [Spirochaetaceae bacterium]